MINWSRIMNINNNTESGPSSVVEHFVSMPQALGLIPSAAKFNNDNVNPLILNSNKHGFIFNKMIG